MFSAQHCLWRVERATRDNRAMANASTRDARAGYGLYRRAGGDIGRTELNRALSNADYGPVSKRMVTHYRNLLAAGFDRYISINRFDVARAARPYEDLAASPRYQYSEVGEGVRLLVAKRNRLWQASGQVVEIGEAGAVVRLVDSEYREGLAKARIAMGDFVNLAFLESGRTADGKIVEVDKESDPPTLEVQFTELVSLADLAFGTSAPPATLALRVTSGDDRDVTTDQLGRRLFLIFELIDELRYIANSAARMSGQTDGTYSPPAVIERLSVASPIEVAATVTELVKILLPGGVIGVALRAAYQLPEKRKVWAEGTGVQLDNDIKREEKALTQARRATAEAQQQLAEELAQRAKSRLSLDEALTDELVQLVRDRLAVIVTSLAEAGVTAIEELDPTGDSAGDTE